jgi:tRNA-splicing ligase RtcB
MKHHAHPQNGIPARNGSDQIVNREFASAEKQLATLGGGNHFIEFQASDSEIWVMLHSGSRNIGKQVADFYVDLAKELNKTWNSAVPPDLAFFPLDSIEGKQYRSEMEYCLEFAKASRMLMMKRIMEITNAKTGCSFEAPIDVHHNYARMEHHFGKEVMIHRKGATSARLGEIGIIPGSQGTSSYIVKGLGNKASMESCSHGAGRSMGRMAAERTLNLEEEIAKLDALGIVHAVRNKSDLQEAPGSYKNIDTVMQEQTDLVEIVTKLRPRGVIKAEEGRKRRRGR